MKTHIAATLVGLSMVRVFLTGNGRNMKNIPWIEVREPTSKVAHSTEAGSQDSVNLLEDRGVGLDDLIAQLGSHGLYPTRAFTTPKRGDEVRLGIIFETEGEVLSAEKVGDLQRVLEDGSWSVRVDRNGPIARVPSEHGVISCSRRTRENPRHQLIILSDGSVALS